VLENNGEGSKENTNEGKNINYITYFYITMVANAAVSNKPKYKLVRIKDHIHCNLITNYITIYQT